MKHVVIVGAGVAGISAAVHLADRGYRVTMLEDRLHVGGRAWSFADSKTGDVIDNGQHLLMGCYHDFLGLLRRLGTDHLLTWQSALCVDFVDGFGRRSVLKSRVFGGRNGVALGIIMFSALSFSNRLRALRFAFSIMRGLSPLPIETCQQFLTRCNQNPHLVTNLWEPIILATLNAPINAAAAVLFVEVLRRAFFGSRMDSTLIIPRVALSELFAPLEQYLVERGSTLRLHCRVEEISRNGTGHSGVEDSSGNFVVTQTGERIEYDALVLAVPPRAMHRLAPDLVPPEIQTYSPIISVYLWFDTAWCKPYFTAMLETEVQWIFPREVSTKTLNVSPVHADVSPVHADVSPVHAPRTNFVSLTISAAGELAKQDSATIVATCVKDLQRVFPEARTATCVHSQVIKEKFATVLFSPPVHALRPPNATAHANIFIAGDWTQTHLPATLEGAARSGKEAAEAVL